MGKGKSFAASAVREPVLSHGYHGFCSGETVPVLEQLPLSIPLNTYAGNHDSAERAEPSPPMQPSSGVRNRGVDGRSGRIVETTSEIIPAGAQDLPAEGVCASEQEEEDEVPKSLVKGMWQGLCNVVLHGKFSSRTREEMRQYNIRHGYSELKYGTDVDLPEGFPQLAHFLNSNDSFAVFRRFGTLSARALIQLQIEITELEEKLQELDKRDAADPLLKKRLRGFEGLEGCDNRQRELMEKVQGKLCEYFDLLLRDTQVRALGQAPERHHLGLFNWVWNNKPLAPGKDAFIFQANDFVSAAKHCEKGTRLGDFIETYLDQWPKSRLKNFLQPERERLKTIDPWVDHYAKSRLAILIKALAVALAVGMLLVPVLLLFLVSMSRQTMAGTVFGFVLAFSITMSIVTEAKVHEILIGTAAYGAVLVTFLGNLDGDARTCSAM
ncbi:hypothetical protein BKA64DRAFT_665364 [Cadophora sp. MPI-SDFR-AT-0126]|nr:hypothetical protein BKA64DRAFT_665364 [Leotiomycetes sp. MPI-SDFR-AT-0126]